MSVHDAVGPPGPARPTDPPRGLAVPAWTWLLATAALLVLVGLSWEFLADPTLSAPTRDPAWYTWRAELLMHAPPDTIVRDWGPFGMFSGGYRVTVPLAGALLQRVAGVDSPTFSTLLMIGIPVLTSLTLGAFAYRHRRDPLLFLLTLLASASLFLATPYVGYLDNLMGLYLLALTLPFLPAARTSGGARTAVGLFMALATLTHPTTVAIFVLVLGALGGLHLLTHRFSIPKALSEYGPMLVSAAFGVAVGLAFWVGGLWGETAPFADAALPPPYPMEVFKGTLGQWIGSLYPLLTGPLMAVALGAIAARALRRDGSVDDHERMSVLWMAPYLGVLGFLAGLTYPYYRFMNTTLAPILLIGLGGWVLARWVGRRAGRAGGAVAVAVLIGVFGYIFVDGLGGQWTATGPRDRWFHADYRVPMASVEAYAAHLPQDAPIVFVNDYPPRRVAWGWSKTFANVARAGLEGDQAERSIVYFGRLEDFLAGEPTGQVATDVDCQRLRALAEEEIYPSLSLCFFEDTQERLTRYEGDPAVFLVAGFNPGSPNEAVISGAKEQLGTSEPPPAGEHVAIGEEVVLIQGEGLAVADPESVGAARQAGIDEQLEIASGHGPYWDVGHQLLVLLALALMLVVPGLIAARWFELEDGPVKLALVPGLSIGLLLGAGVLVVAATRSGFGVAQGWATVALAIVGAVGLRLLARRRDAGRAAVMPFVRRSLSLFENTSFRYLMGTQFLALLGDGIVQGGLAKVIAFGGKEGFDIGADRTPTDLLGLVLLTYLPYTLFSPFVGVLIDRFDRRNLLVVVNVVRGILIGLVAVAGMAVGFDDIGSGPLIGALLLSLACTRVTLAIKSAGLPNVLRGRELLKGNATAQAGSAIFQLVGAGFALVGTSVIDAAPVVLVGAVVYLVGGLFARRITNLEHERDTTTWREDLRRLGRDIVEGLGEVRRRPGAAFGVFSFAWLRLQWSFVALAAALVARDVLGGESKAPLYIAAGTGAMGAVLGFLLAQALRKRVAPARLLVSALVAAAFGTLAFAALGGTTGLAVVSFVTALAYFVGKVSVDTIVQRALPDRFRGRGFALFDIALNAGWILSALALWLGWEDRPDTVLWAAGVVFLVVAGLLTVWARRVSLDPEPAEPADPAEPALTAPRPGA